VGRLTSPASSQAGTRANPRMKLALNGLPVLDPNQQVIAVATLLDQSVARSTAVARSASPPPQRPPLTRHAVGDHRTAPIRRPPVCRPG
jgi:hypothetical protein